MKKIAFLAATVLAVLFVINSCVKHPDAPTNPTSSNTDLIINEFCAHSPAYIDTDAGAANQVANHWVELYNPGDTAINFASNHNYFLTEDSTNQGMYMLDTFTIASKGYVLVMTDSPQIANITHMHANFHTSKNGGWIGLYKKVNGSYVALTKHTFPATTSGYSEGRYPDNGTTWYDFASPTPLAPNQNNGTLAVNQ